MLGVALAAWVAILPLPPAAGPQDTGTVDAPLYEIRARGVSVPRPFDDWVFEPGSGHRTTTVIFHPRGAALSAQLWGALVLTTYPARTPLDRVADQRIASAWRPQLGPTFRLLGRDSSRVSGYPAIRVTLAGAVGAVALEAEEYVIARRRDLIVLQFRYPHDLPRDSIAAGYRRVLAGLRIGGASPAAEREPTAAAAVAPAAALPWSLWQVHSYEALVRYDTVHSRVEFAVRVEATNDGPVPADSLAVWLWPAMAPDSLRSGSVRLRAISTGSASRVELPAAVPPQASTVVTVFYHLSDPALQLPRASAHLAPAGAHLAVDWLPRVQPAVDTTGQIVAAVRPRLVLRFDVPETWHAVAPGRMTSDAASLGRRLVTWTSDDVTAATPAFALGPYRSVVRRAGGLGVTLWLMADDAQQEDAVDSVVAQVRAAWIFCSRAFGDLPIPDVNVVFTGLAETRGFVGLVLIGREGVSRDLLYREVARTWWGNSVGAAGSGSGWIVEGFPAWTAIAARGTFEGDTVRQRLVRDAETAWHAAALTRGDVPLAALAPDESTTDLLRSKGAAALEAARRAAGEAAFRAAIRAVAVEHRNGWLSLDDLLRALGSDAAAVLHPFLY
jgi:hypothetical protein